MVLSLQEYQVERDKCKLTVEEIVEADSSHGPVPVSGGSLHSFRNFKNSRIAKEKNYLNRNLNIARVLTRNFLECH